MKKSTIWLLTILMALTFGGLLVMQIMYMNNMVKMRDDQFSEGVRRSLYATAIMLEQEETKHFLEEDMAQVESSSIYSQYADGSAPHLGGVKYTFTTPTLEADITIKGEADKIANIQSDQSNVLGQSRSMQEVIKGQYLYQKGMIDDVILNILSKASNRPIEERADTAVVRGYLKQELANNGLNLPFEFALVNKARVALHRTPGFIATQGDDQNTFIQPLFPGDPSSKKVFLQVYFPSKSSYIFSSVKFMLPTFVFTLMLLIIFMVTIIIAFRQKKLTEMKNDFINNMTHEFKTPISSISLAAQMLNDDSVRKSPAMMQHISTVINDETKRLRFQVEKVLQMSMFDKQKATLRLTDVDANAAIANIIHTFKLKVERYGGHIQARLDAMDSIVNVDEMHFTNVIFNLLDNAVKYRKDDVPLELVVSTRDLSGERLEITVADNGIGIRRDDLKKIFDKFYRVSTGNRHDVKGFGLGLAYVHKMVQELHGEIKVESDYGIGTKFIIILPLTKN